MAEKFTPGTIVEAAWEVVTAQASVDEARPDFTREQLARLQRAMVELAQRLEAHERAPKRFYNTKSLGQGFGQVGDYRVILWRDRKGAKPTYVQIIDDSDGAGFGFTAKQVEFLVPMLQRAAKAAWGPATNGSGDEAQDAAPLHSSNDHSEEENTALRTTPPVVRGHE